MRLIRNRQLKLAKSTLDKPCNLCLLHLLLENCPWFPNDCDFSLVEKLNRSQLKIHHLALRFTFHHF